MRFLVVVVMLCLATHAYGGVCTTGDVCLGNAVDGPILELRKSDGSTPARVHIAGELSVEQPSCVEGPIDGNECHVRRRDTHSGLCVDTWTPGASCSVGVCSFGDTSRCVLRRAWFQHTGILSLGSRTTAHYMDVAGDEEASTWCVVWQLDEVGSFPKEMAVMVACSHNPSGSWSLPVVLYQHTLASTYHTWPKIAHMGDTFVVVAQLPDHPDHPGNSAVGYWVVGEAGVTGHWPGPHTFGQVGSAQPSVAGGNDWLVVAWVNAGDVWVSKFPASSIGAFDGPTKLVDGTGIIRTSLKFSGGIFTLMWDDDSMLEVALSTDGATWSPQFATPFDCNGWNYQCAAAHHAATGTTIVAYRSEHPSQVLVSTTDDNGSSWSSAQSLFSAAGTQSLGIRLEIDNQGRAVVCHHAHGWQECALSQDAGESWSSGQSTLLREWSGIGTANGTWFFAGPPQRSDDDTRTWDPIDVAYVLYRNVSESL